MASMDYETENGGRYDGEQNPGSLPGPSLAKILSTLQSAINTEASKRVQADALSPDLFHITRQNSWYPLYHQYANRYPFADEQRYDRERSASPGGAKRDDNYRGGRQRSASPGGRVGSR
jgi:hypothetical protein